MTAAVPAQGARRFLFGQDFRSPTAGDEAAQAAERAVREAAAQEGFQRGLAQGRQEAAVEIQGRLLAAMERLGAAMGTVLGELDARAAATDREALVFFHEAAELLAGRLAQSTPLADVAEAAREALQHLRGVPHLVIRVAPELVDGTDELLRGLARERGYDGRLVVIGDEDLPPGDARLDWADGGVVRERQALRDAASRAVVEALAGRAGSNIVPDQTGSP